MCETTNTDQIKPTVLRINDIVLDEKALQEIKKIQRGHGVFLRSLLQDVCNMLVRDFRLLSASRDDIIWAMQHLLEIRDILDIIERAYAKAADLSFFNEIAAGIDGIDNEDGEDDPDSEDQPDDPTDDTDMQDASQDPSNS